ncbi:MAG: hypothetical protein R3B09_27505 [Nannocystaceae bacterium]
MRRRRPLCACTPVLAAIVALLAPVADALADAPPYDEETEREAEGEVVIVGLDRAPGRALVIYPTRCTDSLRILSLREDEAEDAPRLAERAALDRDDFAEVVEGAALEVFDGDNYCERSGLYAVPRGPVLDRLRTATPQERQRLFAEEATILRSTIRLPSPAPVVPIRSRLQSVQETLRVLGVAADALILGVESHRYTFRGGQVQAVPIGAAARPELPRRSLPEGAIAAAGAALPGWEERVLKDRSQGTGDREAAERGDAAPAEGMSDAATATGDAASTAGEDGPATGGATMGAVSTGVATTGVASTGVASTGIASTGVASTGTTSTSTASTDAASLSASGARAPAEDEARESTEDDAEAEPPDRRTRLWITALIAGMISFGALAMIRRDRRGRR